MLRRCVQGLVDRLIVFVPMLALLIVLMVGVLRDRSLAVLLAIVFLVGLFLGNLLVDVWVPYRTGGRTPGMRLLGLRIVTEWGGTPTLGAYVLRWLLRAVDSFALGLVGLLTMIFSRRHQRVGDMVARTLVVRSAPARRDQPGDALREQGAG